MRKYEVMVILDQDEDSFENHKNFISSTLSSNDIKIIEEKDVGLRDLSFPINKKNKGHYYIYFIETNNNNFTEIEKSFKLHKGLLRYFLVKQN